MEPVSEPPREHYTKPIVWPLNEPPHWTYIASFPAEPPNKLAEPIAEPLAEYSTGPLSEQSTEPLAEFLAEALYETPMDGISW